MEQKEPPHKRSGPQLPIGVSVFHPQPRTSADSEDCRRVKAQPRVFPHSHGCSEGTRDPQPRPPPG